MNIEVSNRTELDIDLASTETLGRWLAGRLEVPETISIAYVDDDIMADLHERYYGKEGTTDVLSFPYDDNSAEIVLNPYQQSRQAADFDNTASEEVVENIIHAFLHLSGYDHTSTEDQGQHLVRQQELFMEYKKTTPGRLLKSPPE